MSLLVVRHGHAGRRSAYRGDDRERPLSPRGRARAEELVSLLRGYRPQRILSSLAVRFRATVQPLAEAVDLVVEPTEELAEGHGADAARLLERMVGEAAVLCTHGDVTMDLLEVLVPDPASPQRRTFQLQKGEVWVVRPVGSAPTIVEHLRRRPVRARRPGPGG
jgi:phosphohistidine phosphatase SixA